MSVIKIIPEVIKIPYMLFAIHRGKKHTEWLNPRLLAIKIRRVRDHALFLAENPKQKRSA